MFIIIGGEIILSKKIKIDRVYKEIALFKIVTKEIIGEELLFPDDDDYKYTGRTTSSSAELIIIKKENLAKIPKVIID